MNFLVTVFKPVGVFSLTGCFFLSPKTKISKISFNLRGKHERKNNL